MDKINVFKRPNVKKVNLHTHNCIEFVYLYNGEGVQNVNGKSRNVKRGDLLFYNIGEVHCLNSDEELFAINIQIHSEMLDESLGDSKNAVDILSLGWFDDFINIIEGFPPKVTFEGKELVEIETVVMAMYEEFNNKKVGYMSVLFGYLNVLLSKMFRKIFEGTRLDIRENMNKITPEVLTYIENNYNSRITINELAKKSFYNSSYFIQIFKECYGITPIQYINNKRIHKAMEILKSSNAPVEQVVAAVGYSDKKHFYTLFKQYTGLTPAQYRKMNK